MVIFEINNIKGLVNKNEFKRTLQKLGILSLNDEKLDKIFDLYDSNKSQSLDFREFIQHLYPLQNNEEPREVANKEVSASKPQQDDELKSQVTEKKVRSDTNNNNNL